MYKEVQGVAERNTVNKIKSIPELVSGPSMRFFNRYRSERTSVEDAETSSAIKLNRTMNGGFTLIELLVVVLIIGILVAVALPQYQKAVAKADFNLLLLQGRFIHEAQERFYLENGYYPRRIEDLDITIDKRVLYTVFSGQAMDLRLKRHPDLSYVWYPKYLFAPGPYFWINNRRECRVYSDNEALKKLCSEATGTTVVSGNYSGGTYWSSAFPD